MFLIEAFDKAVEKTYWYRRSVSHEKRKEFGRLKKEIETRFGKKSLCLFGEGDGEVLIFPIFQKGDETVEFLGKTPFVNILIQISQNENGIGDRILSLFNKQLVRQSRWSDYGYIHQERQLVIAGEGARYIITPGETSEILGGGRSNTYGNCKLIEIPDSDPRIQQAIGASKGIVRGGQA